MSNPNQWVEQWHLLRPDADFRDITKTNTFTSSYDDSLTHSDMGSESGKPEQFSSNLPRSVMVYPGSDDHVRVISPQSTTESDSSGIPKPILTTHVTTSNNEQPVHDVTLPQQPIVKDLSVEDIRKLTAENTKLNRGDAESTLSLASGTDNKRKVCTLMM